MMPTIQNVIDTIVSAVPGAPLPESVDTIKIGDPSQPVKGIVTTFLATYSVIQQAIDLGANLIITHEPTFYNHLDETEWIKEDPVYLAKRRLIDENNLVIWRFHDYWHMHHPDGVITGVLKQLGWEKYAKPDQPFLCEIPPMSLGEFTMMLKEKMAISALRWVGDHEMVCQRVGLLVGAWGGTVQIQVLGREDVDVIVCGELHEWETSEYVRDAVQIGEKKAVVVIGHANSEEAGMHWLVEWLQQRLPEVTITHVPAGNPFQYL